MPQIDAKIIGGDESLAVVVEGYAIDVVVVSVAEHTFARSIANQPGRRNRRQLHPTNHHRSPNVSQMNKRPGQQEKKKGWWTNRRGNEALTARVDAGVGWESS